MTQFPLNVAIANAFRSPVGRALKGSLKETRPEDMVAATMRYCVDAAPGLNPQDIEDVVLGCAMPEGEQGLNIARNAVFVNRWPHSIAGQTINRFCSSGLQAIVHAAQSIQCNVVDVAIAGGVESMSMVPMGGNKVSLHPEVVENYPEAYISMGHTAERIAEKFNISREDQDAFALLSHQRAASAVEAGYFAEELVPIDARVFTEDGVSTKTFDRDELIRPDTTMAALAKLRPSFKLKGTVHPGNSSPLSDGAASCLLLNDARLMALGLKALGRLRGYAVAGVAPEVMGIGPVPAIRKLLKQTGLSMSDIDLFEVNEAFAAQAVYCQRELGIPEDKLNIYGGAIALGHPLGCTGAKLTATLLHALQRRQERYGIVAMCIGGGMGAAGLFEVNPTAS
jgi:acetyl-CoA acyltransferase